MPITVWCVHSEQYEMLAACITQQDVVQQ